MPERAVVAGKLPRPSGGRRWSSFIADEGTGSRPVRGLHEATNPTHRVRVEYDVHTLLIHLSDEDGAGWTTVAVDRTTRRCAVAQADTARGAYESLYQS